MANYIVLTIAERLNILSLRQAWAALTAYLTWENFVQINRIDFTPVEIQGNLFILPLSITADAMFNDVKIYIKDNMTLLVREVLPGEFL